MWIILHSRVKNQKLEKRHYTALLNGNPRPTSGRFCGLGSSMIGESARVSRTFCHAPLAPATETDRCEARSGWILQFEMGLRIAVSLRMGYRCRDSLELLCYPYILTE